MRLSHTLGRTSVAFDDPNLVSGRRLGSGARARGIGWSAGFCRRASQCDDRQGSERRSKVASLVGGMLTGADSIDDVALLCTGGVGRVFAWAYAPSTPGSFLRDVHPATSANSTRSHLGSRSLWPGVTRVPDVSGPAAGQQRRRRVRVARRRRHQHRGPRPHEAGRRLRLLRCAWRTDRLDNAAAS